jgi:hypothetical protein
MDVFSTHTAALRKCHQQKQNYTITEGLMYYTEFTDITFLHQHLSTLHIVREGNKYRTTGFTLQDKAASKKAQDGGLWST